MLGEAAEPARPKRTSPHRLQDKQKARRERFSKEIPKDLKSEKKTRTRRKGKDDGKSRGT